VESSCEFGNEPSVSIKYCEIWSLLTTRDLLSSALLRAVNYLLRALSHFDK
jgi:hypothetical protein